MIEAIIMTETKKFIKTADKETADRLMTCGFQLISQIGNMYTFLNNTPKHFNFDVIDKKKVIYDNILSL